MIEFTAEEELKLQETFYKLNKYMPNARNLRSFFFLFVFIIRVNYHSRPLADLLTQHLLL